MEEETPFIDMHIIETRDRELAQWKLNALLDTSCGMLHPLSLQTHVRRYDSVGRRLDQRTILVCGNHVLYSTYPNAPRVPSFKFE